AGIEVGALLADAGGHPLFIDALVRHRLAQPGGPPVRLDGALRARVAKLTPQARRLLELIAVAGRPIPRGVAARALGLAIDELGRVDAVLRAGHLARTGGVGPADVIEPYHDRIRETVLGGID